MTDTPSFTAFAGDRCVASGSLAEAAEALAAGDGAPQLLFDDATGRVVELDLRHGPEAAMAGWAARQGPQSEAPPRQGRGRPRLGVVAREVTLLPRHWDWLAGQPGGASAALRRLVDEARRANAGADRAREAQAALYRVMTVLAGDRPGFEEASRALFAGDRKGLATIAASWPADISAYLRRLAERM